MAESATSVGSLTFLGLFAMFSLSPRCTFYASRRRVLRQRPSQARSRSHAPRWSRKRDAWSACPLHPETSYWLGGANEMAPVNTILIILNSAAVRPSGSSKFSFGAADWGNSSSKTRRTCGTYAKRSVNHSRDWLTKTSLPDREIGLSPCRFICNGLTGCHRRRSFPMTVRSISNICGA